MVLVGRFENTVSRCIYRPWDDLKEVKNEAEKRDTLNRDRGSVKRGSNGEGFLTTEAR